MSKSFPGSLIVTGVTGFVGHHVAAQAAARGIAVHGIARADSSDRRLRDNLASFHVVDLRTEWPNSIEADALIHLAGLAAVGPSFDHPQEYIADNSAMMTTIGEQSIRGALSARLLVVSTGAVYAATDGHPVTELTPLRATSPYAVSKILVERQAEYYRSRGADVIVARPFNHVGPGQMPGFIVPDLHARLLTEPTESSLVVGDLTTKRDYTDVRDVSRAYLDLVTTPRLEHDVYNVSSGISLSGEDILAYMCTALGRPMPKLIRSVAQGRPNDIREIVGSSTRITGELGWHPQFDIAESIADFIRATESSA